jgi:hypothetical protein
MQNGHTPARGNCNRKENHHMKPYSYTFFAAIALMALGLTGCQQPQATATPAPATTVVEDVHRGHDDGDARKMQDRDHPRPDDADHRDHPDDPNRR